MGRQPREGVAVRDEDRAGGSVGDGNRDGEVVRDKLFFLLNIGLQVRREGRVGKGLVYLSKQGA